MTSDRSALADAFLSTTDWANATRAPLAGDASNRRYERLSDPATGKTAVLMDAPPQRGEDVRPFVRIDRHLRSVGLSAPEIFAADETNGFLLLEDLGDTLFARVLPQNPTLEPMLYRTATDALVVLHAAPMPKLTTYDPDRMADLAALALTKYRAGILGQDAGVAADFTAIFRDLLARHTKAQAVLIQRDYHAENLLWLADRDGVARVGLLDFQDAMAGHRAYDLVSLLQDARRDVPPAIEELMIDRYLRVTGENEQAFRTAYAALGAQRNLRILGVFARLATDYGKPHYVDLIPRVWEFVQRNLANPALDRVVGLLADALPEPTPENLQILKDKCPNPLTP